MKRPWLRLIWRALLMAAAVSLVLGLLHRWGVGLALLLGLAVLVGAIAWMFPRWGVQGLDSVLLWVRRRLWARESGRFHSFAGVTLRIVDDGRQIWIGGDGLQRVLGRREPDDALAARLAGQWQRDADGALLLRVEAVVQHLQTMPGRSDVRVQRFRRYLERDVVYPARQRRGRS